MPEKVADAVPVWMGRHAQNGAGRVKRSAPYCPLCARQSPQLRISPGQQEFPFSWDARKTGPHEPLPPVRKGRVRDLWLLCIDEQNQGFKNMDIIKQLEQEQIKAITAKRAVPEFGPGDTLKVMVKVIEGNNTRNQAYEGVCIARSGAGLNESFTVRKISYGEGVERVFPIYSPFITSIEVLRRGKVRRAKLYYLRGRRGKSARIAERTDARARRLNAAWKGFKKPKGEAEDLTQINGIDADLMARLKQLNCIKLEQIANFSDEDIANVDENLQLDGKIERDDWVGQAQRVIAEASAALAKAEADAAAAEAEGEAKG